MTFSLKNKVKGYGIAVLLVFMCWGCSGMTKSVPLGSFTTPSGTDLLICEALQSDGVYEIRPFRRTLELPGIRIIGPPRTGMQGKALNELVREMFEETSAHMILIISPITTVEKRYNPYPVFKGWTKKTYKTGVTDGRTTYSTRDEPVTETQYRNKCIRISYQISRYDRPGEWMGSSNIMSPDFQGCPAATDKDLSYDEIEVLMTWMKSNIAAQ